jgi:hypothetical protein
MDSKSKGIPSFDVVLHDGSPNIGGAKAHEAMTQSTLVIDAVRLAAMFLAPRGAFITKVFRSQYYIRFPFGPPRGTISCCASCHRSASSVMMPTGAVAIGCRSCRRTSHGWFIG